MPGSAPAGGPRPRIRPPVGCALVTRTLIKNLAPLPDGTVTVAGWVDTVRDQKKVQFVILRDESGAVQLVNPATTYGASRSIDVRASHRTRSPRLRSSSTRRMPRIRAVETAASSGCSMSPFQVPSRASSSAIASAGTIATNARRTD